MGKKKDKTPLLLKIIRSVYPWAERWIPALAYRFFARLFFTPLRYKPTDKELKAESFSDKFTIIAAGKKIQGYRWGHTSHYVMVVHGWAGRATQFRRFVMPLQQAGFSVIGFDGPAHGQSEGKRTTIVEFEEVMHSLNAKFGEPEAVIAHSFGGGAVLFAASRGLSVKKLINIASPTIGDRIIDTYLKAIGGTKRTKGFFKNFVEKKYGKPFDAFTALGVAGKLTQPPKLLLVHDDQDMEVTMHHPEALLKVYPGARLYRTSGLGHTRLLKDNGVIQEVVTFIST
jgi:hypothetical protein